MRLCFKRRLPWLVLGSGSNLLVGDGGVRGIVVRLGGHFAEIDARVEGGHRARRCGSVGRHGRW